MLELLSLRDDVLARTACAFFGQFWKLHLQHITYDIHVKLHVKCNKHFFDCVFQIRAATSRRWPKEEGFWRLWVLFQGASAEYLIY